MPVPNGNIEKNCYKKQRRWSLVGILSKKKKFKKSQDSVDFCPYDGKINKKVAQNCYLERSTDCPIEQYTCSPRQIRRCNSLQYTSQGSGYPNITSQPKLDEWKSSLQSIHSSNSSVCYSDIGVYKSYGNSNQSLSYYVKEENEPKSTVLENAPLRCSSEIGHYQNKINYNQRYFKPSVSSKKLIGKKIPPPPPPRDPNVKAMYYFRNNRLMSRESDSTYFSQGSDDNIPDEYRTYKNETECQNKYCANEPPRSRRPIQICDIETLSSESENSVPRTQSVEEALQELEDIYNSLGLSDEDLLDRAERRDLPTLHQNMCYQSSDELDCITFNRVLPKTRRSGVPDIISDDMAYRRLNKKESKRQNFVPGSFLLVLPTVYNVDKNHRPSGEPDVTLDDVVFRSRRQHLNFFKVPDPQPPFGIPLGPIVGAAPSDYLHAVPEGRYKPSFHPRKIPDTVEDDLAFRALRKENKYKTCIDFSFIHRNPFKINDFSLKFNNSRCKTKNDTHWILKKTPAQNTKNKNQVKFAFDDLTDSAVNNRQNLMIVKINHHKPIMLSGFTLNEANLLSKSLFCTKLLQHESPRLCLTNDTYTPNSAPRLKSDCSLNALYAPNTSTLFASQKLCSKSALPSKVLEKENELLNTQVRFVKCDRNSLLCGDPDSPKAQPNFRELIRREYVHRYLLPENQSNSVQKDRIANARRTKNKIKRRNLTSCERASASDRNLTACAVNAKTEDQRHVGREPQSASVSSSSQAYATEPKTCWLLASAVDAAESSKENSSPSVSVDDVAQNCIPNCLEDGKDVTMDHQLNCKSILKRKSLETPVEDIVQVPVIELGDPAQPQCSLKQFNHKSYRQGILKKNSASFDDDSIQKPILKNRCQSFDDETMLNFNELHSILKRKTSEPHDSLEPHGILKKREMAFCRAASLHQPTATVDNDDIRPILKQKKFEPDSSEESGYPRPILKKNSIDCSDDKKPILKPSRGNSPANCVSSNKRISVAQRVSNLESIMQDSDVYKKPVRENLRSTRDRSRFHTQPVTPSEINAIKKTTHSENNAATVPSVSTSNHSTEKLATDVVMQIDNRGAPVRASLKKRAYSVSTKNHEFQSIFDKTTKTITNITSDFNCNITAKSRPSKYNQCQEKRLSVANRYTTQPVTNHELQEAKNLNSAKYKNDDDNNGIADKNYYDHIEKKIDLNNVMEEKTTKHPKKQTNDKNTSSPKINFKLNDEEKKIPEIKVQRVKSLKEPNDSERIKSHISRNVAINRSFNSNSKLELLRQHKFGDKSKENEEFSKSKKHVGTSSDNTDGTSIINGGSIKDRLVALKKSGQTDWQKRILKIKPEDHEVSNSSINMAQDLLRKQLTRQVKSTEEPIECVDNVLVDRLNRLETSSKDWKKRVEQKDSTNFTVAGKMQNKSLPPLTPVLKSVTLRSSLGSIKKKTGEESCKQTNIRRSHSLSDSKTKSYLNNKSEKIPLEIGSNNTDKEKTVNVPVMIDDDFDKFFGSAVQTSKDMQISDVDFDHLKSTGSNLLIQRKKVKAQQRKHEGSKNPLKALATNQDLSQQQYIENKSNLLLQRSLETSTINTPLAREALAALASKEDFASVNLRKSVDSTPTLLPPFKDLMLLHLKGRRRVQTRLVPSIADSVNQGDCYVLVTPSQIFVWIGEYSNVIERSHAAKVAQSIFDKKDLGCKFANQLFTINCDASLPNSQYEKKFWTLLGVASNETSTFKGVGAGHPDEDELYESAIVSTNVVYEVVDDELVFLSDISETMPKIEILSPSKTLVFDFGSEVYVWYGKNVNITKRKPAVRLARQLFDDSYDYSQYDVSPIDVASCLGDRSKDTVYVKAGAKRPEWTLFAKITQHMETVLFREKFADWPDYSRVIKLTKKSNDKEKTGEMDIDWSTIIKALDVDEMLKMTVQEPDLVLEGSHLGRGSSYYDKDTCREYVVNTISVTMWHIQEFDSTELDSKSIGQLHSGDSYIIRWTYNIFIQGRELSGLPSRRMVSSGRNRCAYWYWHGRKATQNDQGAAALLTVQLDTEQGPQLRVDQGHEPPAFWNLFRGMAIVYRGKRNETPDVWRLFMVHGANENEAHLTEVTCSKTQLRSQTSFVLLNTENGTVFVWHGSGSSDGIKELSMKITNQLLEVDRKELGLTDGVALQQPKIFDETKEPSEFFQALGCMNSRRLYVSHQPSRPDGGDMKLFHFSSVLGNFKTSLVSSAYVPSPYPYLQDHLYNVSQPATFMLDAGEELWLWQGWWPETAAADDDAIARDEQPPAAAQQRAAGHRGSLSTRLHAERRAAMQTALDYWRRKHGDGAGPKAYLVWAGLEPLRFTDCFPEWHDRDDIAEINMKHDHKPGETLTVETELARITQKSYPPAQLLQRPLPDGVDPTKLELYLSPDSFEGLLGMSKTEFLKLPKWKRTKIKQSVGLF